LIQQHKLAQLQQRQQQHLLQPFSQMQQPQVGIPRQPQLRPPLAQPGMQLGGPVRTPVENAICSRRIKQYLFHKRHRPEVSFSIILIIYEIMRYKLLVIQFTRIMYSRITV
jgi:hypothetical protein